MRPTEDQMDALSDLVRMLRAENERLRDALGRVPGRVRGFELRAGQVADPVAQNARVRWITEDIEAVLSEKL